MRSKSSLVLLRLVIALGPSALLMKWLFPENPSDQVWHVAYALYYMPICLLVGFAGFGSYRLWQSRTGLTRFFRENLLGFVLSVVLSAFCWLEIPPTLRIQWDESALFSSSQNLHFFRAYLNAQEAVPKNGVIQVIRWIVDKRPPLYPILVSFFHDVFGIFEVNAFRVNSAVLCLSLCVLFYHVRRRFGLVAGISAQFLLLSTPTLLLCASSGGYDLLSGLLFFLTLIAAINFVRESEGFSLIWFLSLGALFSYCRQESVILFLLMLAFSLGVLRLKRIKRQNRDWLVLSFLPLVLVPVIFMVIHTRTPEYYENGENPVLSYHYLSQHLVSFARVFFNLNLHGSFSGYLNTLGLSTLIFFGIKFRNKLSQWEYILPVLTILVSFFIPIFWFYGDAFTVGSWRLFINTLVLLSVAPIFLYSTFPTKKGQLPVLLLSALLFLHEINLTANGGIIEKGPRDLARESLEKIVPKIRESAPLSIIVSNVPMYFVTQGLGALTPQSLIDHWPALERAKQEAKSRGETQHIFILRLPNAKDEEFEMGPFRDLEKRFVTSPYAHYNGAFPMEIKEVIQAK